MKFLPRLSRFTRRIWFIILINAVLIAVGTIGYVVLEGWSVLDALYMTVITIGSVGYGEVGALSSEGQVFTIFFIVAGVSFVAASITMLAETILSAELRGEIREAQMNARLEKLTDHVIISGYGRVGKQAAELLMQEKQREVVIVDLDAKLVRQLQDEGKLAIEGDATDDDVLRKVGVERAWGLLVTAGQDADNLFIVLSARTLNPDLTIVARSSRLENESKMLHAGADRVVSPYSIGGQRMANSLLRPHLTNFLEGLTVQDGVEVWLDEMYVGAGSSVIGQTVAQLDLRQRTGMTLLAILRGRDVFTPDARTFIEVGDQLILIGTRAQLDQFEELVGE